MPALQLDGEAQPEEAPPQLETDLAYRETSEYLKVFSQYIVAAKPITVAIEQKRSKVIKMV